MLFGALSSQPHHSGGEGPGVVLGLLQPTGEPPAAAPATAHPRPHPGPAPGHLRGKGRLRPRVPGGLASHLTWLSWKEMTSPLCSRSPHCRGAQGPPSRAFCLRLDPRTARAAGPPLSRPRSRSHAVGIERGPRPWDQGEGLLSAHSAPSELAPLSPTAPLAPRGWVPAWHHQGGLRSDSGELGAAPTLASPTASQQAFPTTFDLGGRERAELSRGGLAGEQGRGRGHDANAACPGSSPAAEQRRGGWGPARALV